MTAVETVMLWLFAFAAVLGAVLVLAARHPMRVALALVGVMLSLAGIYGLIGAHAVAVFQVLVYVGAVMVFMVYVIMLLDVRDPSFVRRWSRLLAPGLAAAVLFLGAFAALVAATPGNGAFPAGGEFALAPFSAAFLARHWLPFELASVLLLVAVVAVLAVVKGRGKGRG